MGCTTRCVFAYVENVTYVPYMLPMVGIVNYNLMLSEDIARAQCLQT